MICPRRSELGDTSVFKVPSEDVWREDGTCSWCGSLNPIIALKLMRDGVELGPTDKTYKVYVGDRRKFYFQHFDREQCEEFIAMLNAGQLRLGFPGRFYVKPFFIQYRTKPS